MIDLRETDAWGLSLQFPHLLAESEPGKDEELQSCCASNVGGAFPLKNSLKSSAAGARLFTTNLRKSRSGSTLPLSRQRFRLKVGSRNDRKWAHKRCVTGYAR